MHSRIEATGRPAPPPGPRPRGARKTNSLAQAGAGPASRLAAGCLSASILIGYNARSAHPLAIEASSPGLGSQAPDRCRQGPANRTPPGASAARADRIAPPALNNGSGGCREPHLRRAAGFKQAFIQPAIDYGCWSSLRGFRAHAVRGTAPRVVRGSEPTVLAQKGGSCGTLSKTL